MKAFGGFPGKELLVFNFCSRKESFSATGVRWIPNGVVDLGKCIAEAGSARTGAGAALVVAAKAGSIMEVHCLLGHPSESITRKTAEAMKIATTEPWGPSKACL